MDVDYVVVAHSHLSITIISPNRYDVAKIIATLVVQPGHSRLLFDKTNKSALIEQAIITIHHFLSESS